MREYRLELQAPPDTVDVMHDFLKSVWADHPVLESIDEAAFETALAEIVSNVFKHNPPPVTCAVDTSVDESGIVATITDSGAPVPGVLDDLGMPDAEAEGGRGLALVKLLTDRFTYERRGDVNVWTIARGSLGAHA
ncbi:ATP-binding protein [Gryllotalpicola ginsengisoli]|uniref:ATP-binding protein n=1 Tax=Gryllotalpicola ginsengisoli TaxID=444608 RepID=UPI0003B43B9D|nr:ATP-binding protein [Gryllotalpicola ginsengisoli]